MFRSFNNAILKVQLNVLRPEQRFVNLLFYEIKLKSALRYSAGHILGHAMNLIVLQHLR